jgi:glycosyltransferase involved in cell wall biosynthesis
MEPIVSIVLPTHNRMATLPRAVSSVLAQTMTDFELIVVDDASGDGSVQWLASLEDSRIRVIHCPSRNGASHARNIGIRAARAELISFQDSDDVWLPQKLEIQLACIRRQDKHVGWVGGAYQVGQRIVRSAPLTQGQDYDHELLVGEPFVTPTWFVRRDCLFDAGLFDESMPCLEDWDLIFKLADRCRFIAVEDVVLQRYGSADSLFADQAKRRQGLDVVLTRHAARWKREPKEYARWCTELGRLYAVSDDFASSRKWLNEALRHDRLQPRAAGLYLAGLVNRRLMKRLSRSRLALIH